MESNLDTISKAVQDGDDKQAVKLVKEAVERLSLPEGGLMIFADVRDANTPMENIEAMCEAGEEYCLANKPG